jgi:transposase
MTAGSSTAFFARGRPVVATLTFPHRGIAKSSAQSIRHLYKKRNVVERYFCKLKHFRRVATRFDKLARNFLAAVMLASARIWLRDYESTT